MCETAGENDENEILVRKETFEAFVKRGLLQSENSERKRRKIQKRERRKKERREKVSREEEKKVRI